jgi:sugar porter (SP) family MFS transporter
MDVSPPICIDCDESWVNFKLSHLSTSMYGYQTSMLNTLHHSIVCDMNSTVIINPTEFFKPCVEISTLEWSIVISIIYVGGLCGNFIPNFVSKYLSPVVIIWFANFPAIVGVLLISVFSNVWCFIVGRFLMGFTAGFVWNIIPIHFSDIAPAHLRGSFGVSLTLGHYLCMLLAQSLGIVLSFHPGWRVLIALSLGFSVVQMVCLIFVQNSPRWLIQHKQNEKAERSLVKLRQGTVEEEFKGIENEITRSKHQMHSFSLLQRLSNPIVITNMILMISLFFLRAFTGSNIVQQYSTDIFIAVGLTIPALATALTGLCNIVAVVVSLFIVDRVGRRRLMIIGVIGQSISFGLLALSYMMTYKFKWLSWFSLLGVLGYILSFSLAFGPLVPLLQTELFPADLESLGVTISTFVDWGSAALSTFLYPSVASLLQDYVYIPFFILNLIALMVVFFLPETKSKSLEQLQHSYALKTDPDQADLPADLQPDITLEK